MYVWLGRKVGPEEGEKKVSPSSLILSVGIVGMLISVNCELGAKHLQMRGEPFLLQLFHQILVRI